MDTNTLYKLMILYMLNKANCPLTNTFVSTFFLKDEYTNYFELQKLLNDMVSTKYIIQLEYNTSTHYEITGVGVETLSLFENDISAAIKSDIDAYIKENNYEIKSENNITAECFPSSNSDYIAHLCVKEDNATLLEINVACVTSEQANVMCSKWKEASPDIYSYIIKSLS